jgi:glycerol kinase
MTDFWLALDQGGHAGRAIAFDARGRVLTQAEREVATRRPHPGWYEQDPEPVVASLEEPLAEVLRRLDGQRCLGAGLATQRSSIACWDHRTGTALAPVISWRDTRAAGWLAGQDLDESAIHARTGLRISAHYGASKLRWCLDELAAVRDAAADGRLAWGPLASFLIFRLTRESTLAADPANASRTLLWDLAGRTWVPSLIERFGLPAGALPPPAPAGAPLGHLRLAPDVSLRLATGDQSAALFAAGAPRPDVVYVNAGTGAFALQLAPWPNDEARLLTSLVRDHPRRPTYALEGTVNGAGSALDQVAAESGIVDWPAAVARADGPAPPLYLNGHSGLGSPWWRPRFESRWIGDGTADTRLLAVLESVVFMLTTNIERLARHAAPQRRIILSGGLSRSAPFARRLASLTGLPVERAAVTEATGRGLAWLTAGGPKDWAPPASEPPVTPRPDPGLLERYRRWARAMAEATGLDPL